MLDITLQFLRDQLNAYLISQTGPNTVETKLTGIVDDMGKYVIDQGSIGINIINIEEERVFKSQLPDYAYRNGQHVVLEPELKLNLHVLFAANLKLYHEALKYISYVLTFFQGHSSFTSEEYPSLDGRIKKLIVELQSLNYEQLNQVWAFIGGKQLPSVIYRIRMIALQDEAQTAIQPPVTTITAGIQRL